MEDDRSDQSAALRAFLESLGYEGSGDEIRGFKLEKLITEVERLKAKGLPDKAVAEG